MEKRRILIIEDQSVTRKNMVQVLRHEGYEVAPTANGREAVALLAAFRPDMVLTDLIMPELDGFGVLNHVQRHFPHTSVIIISANATPETEKEVRLCGARDFIAKPFDFSDLLVRIRSVLPS